MTITELRKKLFELCESAGGIKSWADSKYISFGYVSAVIRGDSNPGRKILNAMGMRKSFSVKKKPKLIRFEDI